MATKGIDLYSFASSQDFEVQFTATHNQYIKLGINEPGKMHQGHVEVSYRGWNPLNRNGDFSLEAYYAKANVLKKTGKIAWPSEGLHSQDLDNMLKTTSIINDKYTVCYGFFDAKVRSSNKAYVYITENYTTWMADLIKKYPAANDAPFGKFALAGAHDAGMFTGVYNSKELVIFQDAIKKFIPVGGGLVPINLVQRIITNLAYTQKDTITTLLNLGVRHFDFRPGHNYPPLSKTPINAQHLFIPGYSYDSFLTDVVNFLKKYPGEIVSVNIKFDGFASNSMIPSDSDVDGPIDKHLENTGIKKVNLADARNTPYSQLVANNQRLVLQKGNGNNADSYSDSYKTDDINVIVNALTNTMNQDLSNKDWVVLQLQGTYNASTTGIMKAVGSLSDASSPILYTKAFFDSKTYPWVSNANNVASKLKGNQMLVLLNDFTDNALVHNAITITKQRMGLQ